MQTKSNISGPLKPRQLPANPESAYRLPGHNFLFTTDDVSALARLLYALKDDLLGDVRLYANADGVRISETIVTNNIFIFMNIEKSSLVDYECDGENVICFAPIELYDIIKTHQTGCMLTLEIVVDPVAKRKRDKEKKKQREREKFFKSNEQREESEESEESEEVLSASVYSDSGSPKGKQKRARICSFIQDNENIGPQTQSLGEHQDHDDHEDRDDVGDGRMCVDSRFVGGDDKKVLEGFNIVDDEEEKNKTILEEDTFNNNENLKADGEKWGRASRGKQMFMQVTVRTMDETGIFEYEVPLLRSYRAVYKAKPQEKDYFLALDTTVFVTNILDTFASLRNHFTSDYITVDCMEDRISFYMKGESSDMMKNASFTMITRKDPSQAVNRKIRKSKKKPELSEVQSETKRKKVQAPRIVADYCLVYLLKLRKLFSINRGFIFMYIEENYPLVFRVNVGTLGSLHAVLMFKTEEEEEDN